MTSQFGYINAPLPTAYQPPVIAESLTISTTTAAEMLTSNDIQVHPETTGTVADQILSIFRHEEILMGNPAWMDVRHNRWVDQINRFVTRNEPLLFVAMAFPYKVPNPLKNGERRFPDLGEALMLRRFDAVLDAVQSVYPPGAHLTILEEGILGRCQGVDPGDIGAYRAGIEQITLVSGVNPDRISFHSLDDMVTRIENFEARWYFEQERLRALWDQGEPQIRGAYDEIHPGQRSTVPARHFDPQTLAEALDSTQTDSALRYVREYLNLVSHRQFFAYRALINLRDVTGYLEEIAPNSIKLTVSPKPENLAVIPINRNTRTLPYHGRPVMSQDGAWTIEYFGSLGTYGPLTALHLDGDADVSPIGYLRRAP
ncbi:MAG: isocyanide synthase family protein [Propionibacteriaceae bacterium]|nr:isocyanide synthase family protein [Propionibacteriaceae bacterium]